MGVQKQQEASNGIVPMSKGLWIGRRHGALTEGASSVFSILPRSPVKRSAADADRQAIASDWKAVGDDFRQALEAYRREQKKELQKAG